MENFNLHFDDKDCVYNVVWKAVLPDSIADEIVNNHVLGEIFYQEFIVEKLKVEKSVWSALKKRKLKTFEMQGNIFKSSQQSMDK